MKKTETEWAMDFVNDVLNATSLDDALAKTGMPKRSFLLFEFKAACLILSRNMTALENTMFARFEQNRTARGLVTLEEVASIEF